MGVCDVPVNPSFDGVIGWPLIDERITQFNAMAGKFEFLRNVPKDATGWAKLGVRTDVHVLTLEILNPDGSKGGIIIDTGNLADPGISLSAPRWDQWKAAHPENPTGVWGDIGINGLTPHEHFIAKRAENLRRRQHNPLPTDTWSQTSKQIRVAADTPDTTEQKGQISPTGTPLRGHQTIILPCVGANLSNGH